jgi:hypothetical protein
VSPDGFAALDPAQAPGNCGDIQANLRDERDAAPARRRERLVKIDPTTHLPGVAGTFVEPPLPSGLVGKGVVVVITTSDGSPHELEF